MIILTEMKLYRIIISGTVQGVGYRYFAKRIADRLNITGWVRNRRDGTVETLSHIPNDEIKRDFLNALREGPPTGGVTSVECNEEEGEENFQSYEITF